MVAARDPDILITKLLVPAIGSGVRRERVRECLERGERARLTLLVAPTGWGKTFALAGWAAGRSAAWLSLDAADDDPARFWGHLVAAVERAQPGFDGSHARQLLRAGGSGLQDEIAHLLCNELTELEPLAIVLDDFQALSSERLFESIARLVERAPAQLRFAISSQTMPPLPLGRLRALGQLVEIGVDQLRFDIDDAATLMWSIAGRTLEPAELSVAVERTEGWAAGLQLAALGLRDRKPGSPAGVLPFDYRHLVAYLWDELVATQPVEIQEFLLETAVLERLCVSLCDALRAASDSGELLEAIAARNLFLVRLDETGEWFRYHDLFRELLRRELARRRTSTEVAQLHERAGAWHASRGEIVEAVEHTLTAGDVDAARALIAAHWMTLYGRGRGETVAAWLERLPVDVLRRDPLLCLVRAGLNTTLGRRLDDVEPWLAAAEAAEPAGPIPGFGSSASSSVAIVRTRFRLHLGDVDGALASARQAAALEVDPDAAVEALIQLTLGEAELWAGETVAARRRLADAIPMFRAVGEEPRACPAAALYALTAQTPDEAQRDGARALEAARATGLLENGYTAAAHIALASGLRRRVPPEADEHLRRAVTLARRHRFPLLEGLALLELAALAGDLKRRGELGALFDEASAAVDLRASPILAGRAAALRGASVRHVSRAATAEPLSPSELRVLRLYPTNLSYREMALTLHLSLSTVRTHSRHIRRKLGASTRGEALERAREQHLV
jgi:LuxR family maltose regulon positive regulatory protein